MSRAAFLALGALLACGSAGACPGGDPAAPDSLIFDYPVIRSPALLSLRAPSVVRSRTENPACPDTASAAVTGAPDLHPSSGSQASSLSTSI